MNEEFLKKFPIKVGYEANVEGYAATLSNGEEQLLITREGNLYLTDGKGSFNKINIGTGSGEIDIDLSDYVTKETFDNIVDTLATKEELKNNLSIDSLIAKDNIEIKDNGDGTLSIGTNGEIYVDKLPTFSKSKTNNEVLNVEITQSIPCTDSRISYIGDKWVTVDYSNKTLKASNSQILDDSIIFYLSGTAFNIESRKYSSFTKKVEVYINDKLEGSYTLNNGDGLATVYTKTFDKKGIYKIELKRANDGVTNGYDLNLASIGIDKDAKLLTEDEYNNREIEKENNFPVKVGDDTIQTEEDMSIYASTLTNGEQQLLIIKSTKEMFITDGIGGYIKLGNVGSEIDDEEVSEDKVYSSDKTQKLLDTKIGIANIIAGSNIEIMTDEDTNTLTINSNSSNIGNSNLKSLPFFGI